MWVYNKTYKVSLGDNDYVLIHKEQLNGYPNSIIKAISGDGRRYINEDIRLIIDREEKIWVAIGHDYRPGWKKLRWFYLKRVFN